MIHVLIFWQGGCCSSFKIEEKDEKTGETVFVSRFGTAADGDESWFDFTCGETVT